MGSSKLYYVFGIIIIFVLIVCYENQRFFNKITQRKTPGWSWFYHDFALNAENGTVDYRDMTIDKLYPILQSMLDRIRGMWYQGRLTDKRYFDEQYINIAGQLRSLISRSEKTRSEKLKKLSDYVRQRILEIQNPADCDKAQLLVHDYGRIKCGFGCTLHRIVKIFFQSVYTNRTFVLVCERWKEYEDQKWEHYLLPIGKCRYKGKLNALSSLSEKTKHERVVQADESIFRAAHDWSVPKNILTELTGIHTDPFAWWVGQFSSYVFRLQPWFEKELKDIANRIGFQAPIVGLHIRWGTKLTREAAKHEVNEYMDFVETWNRKLEYEGRREKRSVYVAAEDSVAWKNLKAKYANYTFIGAGYANESKDADHFKTSHYASLEDRLPSILTDIYFLKKCDYIVCTLSSNIGRLLYELRIAKAADASDKIQSLDRHYNIAKFAAYRVIQDHSEYDSDGEVDLKIGDVFTIHEDAHQPVVDGYIRYKVRGGGGRLGKVPAYKVQKIVKALNINF